ncbi:ubiquitin carboxyl-terminal hydrolase MINDY-1-like [Carcharodon carcharias]|uniref:ubiquitin carboxyl-terminal hydrolase MINDY-1-like n=1 Tax=Carcharodon carcharias TaxID=13397 RepID=UPI001B7DEC6C|nr:ubiquitin carboxyl-terminal hydrolase MINDY-1-like [Carcharodon carcharias]
MEEDHIRHGGSVDVEGGVTTASGQPIGGKPDPAAAGHPTGDGKGPEGEAGRPESPPASATSEEGEGQGSGGGGPEPLASAEPGAGLASGGEGAADSDTPPPPSGSPCRPEASRSDPASTFYLVKWISWKGEKTPLITQSENGPCPLIAIVNILLLRWKVGDAPPSAPVTP